MGTLDIRKPRVRFLWHGLEETNRPIANKELHSNLNRVLCWFLPLLFLWLPAFGSDYSDELYKRALKRAQNGDFEGAVADFSKVIQIEPRYGEAYAGRANAKYSKHDYDGAIVDGTKAIELEEELAAAYHGRTNSARN